MKSMFKGLMAKSNTTMLVIVVIVVGLLIWGLMSYSKSKGSVMDSMTATPPLPVSSKLVDNAAPVQHVAPTVTQPATSCSAGYTVQSVANPADLLPVDSNAANWGPNAVTPPLPSGQPFPTDMINRAVVIGLDTIGSSLRNANLDLRSDPVIPKSSVGPWNNSTIEPDLMRVPLELGCGPR
jgi:hypothetical protein